MRLWSLHPRYLDTKGLVALWREALLAQAVLREETRGYRNHPQLERFKAHAAPLDALSMYLTAVHEEACVRGYAFDSSKIHPVNEKDVTIPVTTGQLEYEWKHLLQKLRTRTPEIFERWLHHPAPPTLHPMFRLEDGPLASWERPLPGTR